jgi:hypothetical protein
MDRVDTWRFVRGKNCPVNSILVLSAHCPYFTRIPSRTMSNQPHRAELFWAADSRSSRLVSEEIPRLLWNVEVNCCDLKSSLLAPVVARWIQSTHSHLTTLQCIVILFFHLRWGLKWSLSFRCTDHNFVSMPRLRVCYTPRPFHPHSLIAVITDKDSEPGK